MSPEPPPSSPEGPQQIWPFGADSAADSLEISIQNPEAFPEARGERVEPWLRALVSAVAPEFAGFGVRFADDEELRRLNREYRGKDRPTDVLSFPGEDELEVPEGITAQDAAAERYLGDVAISVPTARRQAQRAGHGVDRELQILLLHGALHCLGYDHESDDGTMDELEAELRQRWLTVP
ncbi:MAG: rRNA maturation RNase YbeY [Acidobacteriota bacterium]